MSENAFIRERGFPRLFSSYPLTRWKRNEFKFRGQTIHHKLTSHYVRVTDRMCECAPSLKSRN